MDRLISSPSSYLLLSVLVCSFLEDPRWTEAFLLLRRQPPAPTQLVPSARSYSCSGQQHHVLFMGKGLNKAKNKQAALKQKLEEAKRKKLQEAGSADDTNAKELQKLSDKEIQERNDRLRFEELLKKGSANVLNDYSSDGYLNKQQEEEEIDAYQKGVDRIFEGDPAPEECFEELVSIKSENAIGATGKQRLVPWLRKNSARHGDYLVVISDPRPQSPELRDTVNAMVRDLPLDIRSRMVIVNADSPAENRRWLKKSAISDDKLEVFSDEKMEWMQAYTALGENRWSMTMFVLKEGKVGKLARELDQYGASRTVRNAVKALTEEARL